MAKIVVMFKDPDAVPEALCGLDGDANDVADKLATWIDEGEYLSVEFDLDAGTATVLDAPDPSGADDEEERDLA